MPRQAYVVSPLRGTEPRQLAAFITELNAVLTRMSTELAQLRGLDGHVPVLGSDLDMGGHRIKNVGRSAEDGDLVPRGELTERSLFRRQEDEDFATTRRIIAAGGLEVPPATQPSSAPQFAQVVEQITTVGVTLDTAQTITGQKTFTQAILALAVALGATPAAAGEVRLPNAGRIYSRNLDGTVDSGRLHFINTGQIANLGIFDLTLDGQASPNAILLIVDYQDTTMAVYYLRNGTNATLEILDPSATFTIAAGTAASTNIYWAGARYELENRRGAARQYQIFAFEGQ